MGRYCGDTFDEPSTAGYPWDYLDREQAERVCAGFNAEKKFGSTDWRVIRASIFWRVHR